MRRVVAVVVVATLAVVVAAVAGCTKGDDEPPRAAAPSAPAGPADQAVPDDRTDGPVGGSVRVAVWAAPDPAAPTFGGAAVRSLVLPQLFRAHPGGGWSPALVEPRSDVTGDGATSATFRLRDGAAWSDGSPVTADDLRRTMDAAFVSAVEGPDPDGVITLRFPSPTLDWRRLWSGVDSIAPPRDGVWGGPFVIASMTPGLETVLRRNDGWVGDVGPPLLDEVRLVLVPDATTARQLLERGEVDVVSPPAHTVRAPKLDGVDGVEVLSEASSGGWWVGLFLSRDRLDADDRRAVVATVDRNRFVSTLLAQEATVLDGFGSSVWRGQAPGDAGALGDAVVDLVGQVEEPMTGLLHRSMQRRAAGGARFELRQAEADRVEPWVLARDYQAAIVMTYDGPSVCWRCRWGAVDGALATAADAGDAAAAVALQEKLRDEALLLPLWRPAVVVAYRTAVVDEVRVNPFGLGPAADAWRWRSRSASVAAQDG